MKVSIVIIVLNDKELIKRTLESAINQKYFDKEIVIIDGGSTDGTLEVIKQYENNIDTLISESDNGIFFAMNKAIKYCTGNFISYLNTGDTYEDNDTLSKVFIEENINDYDIIIGETHIYDEDGYMQLIKPEKNIIGSLPNLVPACHQSTFVKADLLKKKPFDTSFKLAGDVDFLVSSAYQNKNIKYLDFPVSRYLLGGITAKRINNGAIELIKIMYDYGLSDKEIFNGFIYKKLIERSLKANSLVKKFIMNFLLVKPQ